MEYKGYKIYANSFFDENKIILSSINKYIMCPYGTDQNMLKQIIDQVEYEKDFDIKLHNILEIEYV